MVIVERGVSVFSGSTKPSIEEGFFVFKAFIFNCYLALDPQIRLQKCWIE